MKQTTAIIQARMGSTRLPGKALLPLGNEPEENPEFVKFVKNRSITVLQYLIERVYLSSFVDNIIVATPDTEEDKSIHELCEKIGVDYFVGSTNNVLDRVTQAAVDCDTDLIVDITGDCPLVSSKHIDRCIELLLETKYDYFSNTLERSWPDGFDVAVVTMEALLKLDELVTDPIMRTHTVWNMTQYPEYFKLGGITAPDLEYFPNWGLTLDTKEDYELLQKIVNHFGDLGYTVTDVINYIKKNPDLLKINKHIQRKIPKEG